MAPNSKYSNSLYDHFVCLDAQGLFKASDIFSY